MSSKSSTPKRKQLTRKERLAAAKSWMKEYTGKNIIRGYSKWFGVEKLCAIRELESIGVFIPERFKMHIRGYRKWLDKKKIKNQQDDINNDWPEDSDGDFAFIAGYTEGGVPFGITHEQMIEILNEELREDAFEKWEEEQHYL